MSQPALTPNPPSQRAPLVILVTGAGRSGTSTVAGALKMLGVEIPGPEVSPNESNPRGFFETKWVVWRNQQMLSRARVSAVDTDPDARRELTEEIRADFTGLIQEWIGRKLDPSDSPAFVIKDPRTIWTADLWTDLLEAAGYRVAYLSMLRHPVEVAGSRQRYYQAGREGAAKHATQTGQLAGWVNVNLESERLGRGRPHSFVSYAELLTDWRSAMRRVRDELGVAFNHDLGEKPHEVDDFIDPTLRRVQADWSGVDAPEWLREIAEEVWGLLNARAQGETPVIDTARFDDLAAGYRAGYEQAWTISDDRLRRAKAAVQGKVEEERERDRTAHQGEVMSARAETEAARAALAQAQGEIARLSGRKSVRLADSLGRTVRRLTRR